MSDGSDYLNHRSDTPAGAIKNLASALWDLAVSAGSVGAQGLVLCVALASAWEAHKTDDPDALTHCILWLVLAQLMRARR